MTKSRKPKKKKSEPQAGLARAFIIFLVYLAVFSVFTIYLTDALRQIISENTQNLTMALFAIAVVVIDSAGIVSKSRDLKNHNRSGDDTKYEKFLGVFWFLRGAPMVFSAIIIATALTGEKFSTSSTVFMVLIAIEVVRWIILGIVVIMNSYTEPVPGPDLPKHRWFPDLCLILSGAFYLCCASLLIPEPEPAFAVMSYNEKSGYIYSCCFVFLLTYIPCNIMSFYESMAKSTSSRDRVLFWFEFIIISFLGILYPLIYP